MQRRLGCLGVFLLATFLTFRTGYAAPLDVSNCAITGMLTADNDLRLDRDRRAAGKPVKVPRAVADKIHRLATRMLASHTELAAGLTCRDIFSPVYRIGGLGRLALFVAEVRMPIGPDWFFLTLYDPLSGATTQAPPKIGAKWPMIFGARDELVRLPLVATVDLFSNGHREIVFEERVHNGTMYNGIVYHYFTVGPDLSLTPLVAYETRVLDPTSDSKRYIRELVPLGPTRLRLDFYEAAARSPARRKLLGTTILVRPPGGGPFRIAERHPLRGTPANELITFCGNDPSDDAFLKDGCDFYY